MKPLTLGKSQTDFLQWAYEQMAAGVPRQLVCDELIYGKVESPLDRQGRSEAEHELSGVMVDRNLLGQALEKVGRGDEAIALYEANVVDQFNGSHPYERLRIIYEKRNDVAKALRVCRIYVALATREVDQKKRKEFEKNVERLQKVKHT